MSPDETRRALILAERENDNLRAQLRWASRRLNSSDFTELCRRIGLPLTEGGVPGMKLTQG